MSLFHVHRKRRTRRRRCMAMRRRSEEVAGIDAEADDDTIEAPIIRWRGARRGHFVLPP
jgi:hypothetical protein